MSVKTMSERRLDRWPRGALRSAKRNGVLHIRRLGAADLVLVSAEEIERLDGLEKIRELGQQSDDEDA